MTNVASFIEFQRALAEQASEIVVTRTFTAKHAIVLPPQVHLAGKAQEDQALPMIIFQTTDGIGVTADNTISDLNIQAPATQRAIFNAGIGTDLGTFVFDHLQLSGQFSFVMSAPSLAAKLTLVDIQVMAADTRHYLEQPQKYGVNALQGAVTIYNFNADATSKIVLVAKNLSIGSRNQPVTGSGIFVSGFGDAVGQVTVTQLTTANIYSTGRIPVGVADIISGALFIVNGAHVGRIIQTGETVTYGVNDMVLDNWGTVDDWQVNGPVTSYGPSSIGFVNFGLVDHFTMTAPITTFGLGSRGYNQYDGTLTTGTFQSITTYGDGAVGVQISKAIGTLTINGNVPTYGTLGNSLVKGVDVVLPAVAMSVKAGGRIAKLLINGNIATAGNHATSYAVDAGAGYNSLQLLEK